MKDLIERALDTARARGAYYADVRWGHRERQLIVVKDHKVDLQSSESLGFGVRVLMNGAWGFASSSRLNLKEADRVAALAVRLAKASAFTQGRPVNLGPPRPVTAEYRTPVRLDPFSVPLEKKIDLLLRACQAMRAVPKISSAEGSIEVTRDKNTFASTEGGFIQQEFWETGCGLEATAVGQGEVQRRSYPNSVGRHQGKEGWEFVERYDLAGQAPRIAEEAVALLSAKPCPSGTKTVILGGSQVALQVHESCGHAIELDRVLGTEASYAGTSFLTPEKLGHFRYGSEVVNITADATLPGGLGTFGYDDEGIPAQAIPVVRQGTFVGYLTSRETAAQLGQESNGAARAEGWNRLPLIRMTNVSLEPGNWSLENLIADTDDGILMETNMGWSIDDRRLNFQFSTEVAWEVTKGKRGALVRNATYAGITPQFWGSCDAICNRDHWTVWGTPNCGKGQPMQLARVGHGASPARFRNVQVGVMKRT